MTPPSTATQLVHMALADYEIVSSSTGVAYAIPRTKPRIARPLRGRGSLRSELAQKWFATQARTASGDALTEAVTTLEGFAAQGDPVPIHTRIAQHEGCLWLDLADDLGRAACISRSGWHITDDVPVHFRRTALTAPLPLPESAPRDIVPHLDIWDLFSHIHINTADQPLVIADLIAALDPDIPHPVLSITGEQGTAKTTATSMLVKLIDPSAALTRKAPKDAEEWVVAASGSWRVALDNIGRAGIPDWLSDSLCRAATGTGDVRRALYENDDIHVIAFRRSVLINGITVGRMSEDLADRAIPIRLLPITSDERKDDHAVWDGFNAAHPRLLGALLDAAVAVLGVRDDVEPNPRPRMIDFARYLVAVDHVFGTTGFQRYMDTKDELAVDTIGNDSFMESLEAWIRNAPNLGAIEKRPGEILEGVMGHERAQRAGFYDNWRPPAEWPKTAQGVGTKLTYMAPALRRFGWHVESTKDPRTKGTIWSVSLNGKKDKS